VRDTQASSTALLIARSMLLAAATPPLSTLVPDQTVHLTRCFLASAPPARLIDFALRHTWSRSVLIALERMILPGIVLHYLVRKQLIEEHVRTFLEKRSDRQLVVLGAGLDTLAWRPRDHGAATAFELDHPATQKLKHAAGLAAAPVGLPADFTRELPDALLAAAPGFDAARPTAFVAEGLLMYFPPERVSKLLSSVSRIAAPESRLVFTFMESRPDQAPGFRDSHRLVDAWLRHRREPFRWSIARAEIPLFLERHGWRLEHLSSPAELRARFLAAPAFDPLPLAEGESIALARRL
jgi:methyltransferase (TIGR00027 family)